MSELPHVTEEKRRKSRQNRMARTFQRFSELDNKPASRAVTLTTAAKTGSAGFRFR
jgi:hypothetical protein